MKIVYITGNRADYGLMTSVLREIDSSKKLELALIVTGMHMMEEFGSTEKLIKKYDAHYIDSQYEKDDLGATPKFLSSFLPKLTDKLLELSPDLILVLGDRAEMLAGAIAGQYLNIPIAHISGGDLTGHVDDPVRHAISKLAHVHFTITQESAERLKKLGEDPNRITFVGSTSLDNIKNAKLPDVKDVISKHNLNLDEPYVLMLQHPVITEVENSVNNVKKTLDAVSELNVQTLVIYPNADATGRKIIKAINENKFVKKSENAEYLDYLTLLKNSSVIIGNSSSGIVESVSFGIPSVNIGTRQTGRDKAENVIDVPYDTSKIKEAINKALTDEKFKEKCKNCVSPYGEGTAGKKIRQVLENLEINKKLLVKEWVA